MHILNGRRRRKVRKVVAGVMVMAFLVTVPASDGALSLYMDNTYDVYAKTAKEKKKEAEEKLNNVQDEIEGIKDKKSEVSKDIDATSQKLDALLESQKKLDKKIQLFMTGEETELDRTVVDEIGDPLMHLLRNSADHGLESAEVRKQRGKPEVGTVRLNAYQDGNNVVIEVSDDGNGTVNFNN